MKISFNWLNQYLTNTVSLDDAAALLTSTGLETEGVSIWESHRGGLKGVVTAEVVSCEKHPDADKLSVCKVNTGAADLLNIVCGAPNVRAGQKVLVACVGAELFFYGKTEGLIIRKAKIRGVHSEGMICAEDELGLGTSHDGIMVLPDETPVGVPAASFFQVASDHVIEIGLTPNRTDAMSHMGVARDLAACIAFRTQQNIALNTPEVVPVIPTASAPVTIEIKEGDGCKRYTGITLTNVAVGPSPAWLRYRLEAIGVKPINSVVDITNYVLHETGHPLHAFDYASLAEHKIVVQTLPEGTPFVTLDGVERKLAGTDLMICDAEKPLCIAGVYGGLGSGVTEKTTSLFIESAWFDPVFIRRSARLHGLNTDASFRFERGADPNSTPYALWRAVNLICEITGAQVASPLIDVGEYAETPWQASVSLRLGVLERIAGQHIGKDEVIRILELLGFGIETVSDETLVVSVPGYRADVTREIDVIEEILRIYGFDQIEMPAAIPVSFPVSTVSRAHRVRNLAANWLINNGFNEVWNNSLSSLHGSGDVDFQGRRMNTVKILNPLSQELDVMRTSMLMGMLENARHNINRKLTDFNLFELGFVYNQIREDDVSLTVTQRFRESAVLALMMTGNTTLESWFQHQKPVGFFDLKKVVMNLCRLSGYDQSIITVEECPDMSSLNAAVSFRIHDVVLAKLGKVAPATLKHFGIKQDIWYGEVNWEAICDQYQTREVQSTPLPKYPDVRRDLSLVLDMQVPYNTVRRIILETAPELIHHVNLFDVYEGEKLPEGRKSYAVSIILRDTTKTLTDNEIDDVMKQMIHRLEQEIGAVLR